MSADPAPLRYRLTIEGMGCSACAEAVRDALSALPGVRLAEVDVEGGTAEVQTAARLREDEATAALHGAGYTLRSIAPVPDAS
jgi:copper chaperone CopZ